MIGVHIYLLGFGSTPGENDAAASIISCMNDVLKNTTSEQYSDGIRLCDYVSLGTINSRSQSMLNLNSPRIERRILVLSQNESDAREVIKVFRNNNDLAKILSDNYINIKTNVILVGFTPI